MGTAMFWSEPNALFNRTLLKNGVQTREEGYVGYIDLNCIVNSNGIYPLEFTSRSAIHISIQQEASSRHQRFFLGTRHGAERNGARAAAFKSASASRPAVSFR